VVALGEEAGCGTGLELCVALGNEEFVCFYRVEHADF